MEQKNAQDAIIQAISHSERREILRIMQRQPESLRYSGILGETQLPPARAYRSIEIETRERYNWPQSGIWVEYLHDEVKRVNDALYPELVDQEKHIL